MVKKEQTPALPSKDNFEAQPEGVENREQLKKQYEDLLHDLVELKVRGSGWTYGYSPEQLDQFVETMPEHLRSLVVGPLNERREILEAGASKHELLARDARFQEAMRNEIDHEIWNRVAGFGKQLDAHERNEIHTRVLESLKEELGDKAVEKSKWVVESLKGDIVLDIIKEPQKELQELERDLWRHARNGEGPDIPEVSDKISRIHELRKVIDKKGGYVSERFSTPWDYLKERERPLLDELERIRSGKAEKEIRDRLKEVHTEMGKIGLKVKEVS